MKILENIRLQYFLLFAIAIVLYINTLHHGFVLDDEVVITKNTFVQKGFSGIGNIFSHDSFVGFERVGEGKNLLSGGRYRPLSLALFAVLYSMFGADSTAFHVLSILLYACCGLMFFTWLRIVMKDITYGNSIAFFTSILFVVHPVHTEVVANVKSCDEQLAFLFGLAALYAMLRAFDQKSKKWLWISGVLFLAGCFAKENAITLVVIGPLAIWFSRKTQFRNLIYAAIPLFVGLIIFILVRGMIIGCSSTGVAMHDPMNNPFLQWNGQMWIPCAPIVKLATIIYTSGQYLRLMIYPHPLTHDYYPLQVALQQITSPLVLLSLFVLLALKIYSLMSIWRRDIAGFGILFFLLALSITSNMLFPVGTLMAERFLFLPSAGFCLFLSVWIIRLLGNKGRPFVLPFFAMVAIILGACTIIRNPAWKDNVTLLRTDLKYSSKSIKERNDLGTILLTKALETQDPVEKKSLLEEATVHLKAAIHLHPTYYDAYLAYGASAYYLEQYKEAVDAYRTATQLFPEDTKAKTGLQYSLQAYGNYLASKNDVEGGISVLQESWDIQPDVNVATTLANYYHGQGELAKVVEWYGKAVVLAPKDAQILLKLSKAYREVGNNIAADGTLQKAKEIDPGTMEKG